MRTYILGTVIALAILISPAIARQVEAASLTGSQINSVIQFLGAFHADQSVIDNVRISLNGGTPILGGQSGINTNPTAPSCVPPMMWNGSVCAVQPSENTASTPTASITMNGGQKSITVNTGDTITKTWSSTNGTSYNATWAAKAIKGSTCIYNGKVGQHWNGLDGGIDTTGDKANGTESAPATADQVGCIFTITYVVTNNLADKNAVDSVTITFPVNPTIGATGTGNACVAPTTTTTTSGGTCTAPVASSGSGIDLCKQQGLDNIDETNYSAEKYALDSGLRFQGLLYNLQNYSYKMGPGQSYSFPVDSNTIQLPLGASGNTPARTFTVSRTVLQGNPYLGSFPHIVNVSQKKCDFNPSSTSCYIADTDSDTRFSGGTTYLPISASPIIGDFPAPYGCHLQPGKQYYVNIRWIRKSDIVDASGNIINSSMASGVLGSNSASMSMTQLSKAIADVFNSKGDSCINSTSFGNGICVVDYSWGSSPLGFPKLTAAQQQAKIAEDTARDAQNQTAWSSFVAQVNTKLPACSNTVTGTLSCGLGGVTGPAGSGQVEYETVTTCDPTSLSSAWFGDNSGWKRLSGRVCK